MQQVSELEHQIIIEELQKTSSVSGDIVELGCYQGDTSILIAKFLARAEKEHAMLSPKRLYLYDSFAGLPPKTQADQSSIGANFVEGSLKASKSALVTRFKRANLPLPKIKKAWFSDLTDADLPAAISLAFLDGDYYNSIKTSLALVVPRLSSDGVIIIHDYHNEALPGVAQATDEFLKTHPTFHLQVLASLAVLTAQK